MKAVALVIVLLSNEGHWLSGKEGSIGVDWSAEAIAIPCDLKWELKLGGVKLAGDSIAIGPKQPGAIKIICPEARIRLPLQWEWRLIRKQDAVELAHGSEKIIAYPADLTQGWSELVKGKRIVLIDRASDLSDLLKRAKIAHARFDDAARLQTAQADIVIVGPESLHDRLFEQAPLAALIRSGAAVAVFRQSSVTQLLGVEVASRALPEHFSFPVDVSLLSGLDAEVLQGWERDWKRLNPSVLRALRVPEREDSGALIKWPAGAQGGAPPALLQSGARDALLLSREGQAKGGRLVLCQMPLGDWSTDPRSQLFLGNLLDLLISPSSSILIDSSSANGAHRPAATIISPGAMR